MLKKLSAQAQIMRAKGLLNSKNELMLYGMIGDWWDGMDALTIVRELDSLSGDSVVVRIHSEGGYITEGLAMYNALAQLDKRVVVKIDGLCASMATVVAMAGDEIETPDNALWMIHKPWGSVAGNAEDLRQAAENLDVLEESLILAYTEKGRVSEESIRSILDSGKDYYLTGSEAVEQGFADYQTTSVTAAASVDTSKLNAPDGKHKELFNFYAVSAANNKPEDTQMYKKLLALKAALTQKGIGESDISDALASAFNVSKAKVDEILAGTENATNEQLTDGVAALASLSNAAPGDPAPAKATDAIDAQAAADRAVADERQRVADIDALCVKHNLPSDNRNTFINNGTSIENVRTQALEILAAQDSQRQPAPGVRIQHTDGTVFRESIGNAMLNRMQPGVHKLDDGAREFRGMSLLNIAAACLERAGGNTRGLSGSELAAKAMHSTSDFPGIVSDVANKVLMTAYNAQPRTFGAFCRQTSNSDFKLRHALEVGGGSSLEKVNELGEFEHGTLTESKKSYKLDTYGRIFSFSRQLLINDDLGALESFMMGVGAQAARKETQIVYDLIKNATGIYTSGNKNLGTGSAVTETALSELRKLMRQMKDADGNSINVLARYLVVNSERETEAQKLLASVLATQTSGVNVFANSLELIVEPELDGVANNPWYTFADPMLAPALEYAYLNGEEGPFLETKSGFEVDGIQLKARHDFGAGFVGHRGTAKNPGA